MANLSLPELEFKITADGTAAIEEIERAEEAAESASRGASGAAGGFDSMGNAARHAGSEVQSAGKGAEEFGKKAESAAKKASVSMKDVGEKVSSIGKSMTAAITVPVVGALAASVKGASDMTETLGKTDVVFGDMTDRVLEWSNSSVSAMGLAQQTALDMAATYGDMATGMGLSRAEAANMSTALVQLGADMASFKNIGIDEVNTALTAVFTGETESLKRLGIVMTQANLQQYALSQGITTQIEKMSQAEQVQLRYQYVMAMTANAQGDFQRTGGNLANQTRALGETIKQAANSFGALLVPTVTKVVSALRNGAQSLSEMDDGTKRTIITIGMVVAAVGPLLLVGGKVLTLISSIQAAMAALSISPMTMGIVGAVAGIAALIAAMKAFEPEVDTTSESYQDLKRSIEGGAKGKLELDTSEMPQNVEVSITADGSAAMQEAKDIIEKLDTDPQFDGKLAIDGDPAKAEQVIAQVKADIAAVEEAVGIDGDPTAANEAIAQLERDLATLKRAVPITEDPTARAELDRAISALEEKLATLKGSVTVTTEGEDGLDSLKEKLEAYDDKTYKATGEFVVSGMGAEAIQEYAEALAAAASATGDYKTAVENLNKLTDQDTQRQVGEVNTQLAEQMRYLTALKNDGILTDDQYQQKLGEATEAANKQIETIQKQGEAQKQLNKQLADGSRANDPETVAKIAENLYGGEHVTGEEGRGALKQVVNGEVEGEQAQIQAGTALNGMIAEQTAARQQLTAAVQEYSAAMAEAANLERTGAQTDSGMSAQEALERARLTKDALDQYNTVLMTSGNPEAALQGVVNTFGERLQAYEGLEQELRSLLSGESGEGLSLDEGYGKAAEAQAAIAEYQGMIDGAVEEAQTKRQEALTALQTTLGELGQGYTEAETNAAISAIEGAGVSIDNAQKALLTSTPDMIAQIAEAVEDGDPSQIQSAIDSALEGVDVEEALQTTGGSVSQGLVNGMAEGTDAVNSAGQALGESAVEGANTGAGCASPSTKTQETGRNLVAGLANGMQDTSPVTAAAAGIGAAAVDAINSAVAAVDSSAVANVGASLAQGLTSGVSANSGSMSSALTSAVQSAASSAGSTASSNGQSIGKNLMSGIQSGIGSMVSSISSAAASAVRSAIAAAKAAASIKSPSQVMRDEVGVQLMRGMEVGVVNRVPATIQVIKESVGGVLSGAAQVINQGGIPAPALPIPAPAGLSIDYERMADAVAARPAYFHVGNKQLAVATRDEAARQQAVRVQQINAGYGGR